MIADEFLYKKDFETALFLRIAMETGIRSIDIPYIEWSCIHGRNVVLPEGKTGNIYRKVNGNYPQISRCSLRIIHLLYRKQKMIFTKSKEYYIHRIRRFWGTGEFSFHSFRYYRRKLEMGITNRNSGAKSDTSIVKKLKYLIKFQLDIKKVQSTQKM